MLFGTESLEIEFLKYIQTFLGCGFLDYLMPKISVLGNGGFIWISWALILIFTKKYRKVGITILLGLLIGLILGNIILKPLIARPRPFTFESAYPLLVDLPADYSHPSGHTLSSFISAFILYKADKRFGYAAFLLATLIAFSRMYLFVHFPTDILGGIFLAYAIHKLLAYLMNKSNS